MEGRVGGLIKTVSFPSPRFYFLFIFFVCVFGISNRCSIFVSGSVLCTNPLSVSLHFEPLAWPSCHQKWYQNAASSLPSRRQWQQTLVQLLGSSDQIILKYRRSGCASDFHQLVCQVGMSTRSCGVMRPASRPHSQDTLIIINSKLYPRLLL